MICRPLGPREGIGANLDSLVPETKPSPGMASVLIESKGLNPSKWPQAQLIWTGLGEPYPYGSGGVRIAPGAWPAVCSGGLRPGLSKLAALGVIWTG